MQMQLATSLEGNHARSRQATTGDCAQDPTSSVSHPQSSTLLLYPSFK